MRPFGDTLADEGVNALGSVVQHHAVGHHFAGVVVGRIESHFHLAIEGALALADTILARTPGHLFGYLVRGDAADLQGDTAAAGRAGRDFLTHYDAEMRANRMEYQEHAGAIADFKQRTEGGKDGKAAGR